MPAKNQKNYTPEELFLSEFGRAIAHPARVRMFMQLVNHGTFRNVDFSKQNHVTTSTSHNHIYKMLDANLVNLEYANHEYHVTMNLETLELAVKLLQIPFEQTQNIREVIQHLAFLNQE